MVLMFCLSEITPMSATNHQCTVPLTQCLSKLLTFSSQSASKIKEDNNRVALQETESCSLVLRLSQLSLHACNFSTLTQHRWKTLDPLFCFSSTCRIFHCHSVRRSCPVYSIYGTFCDSGTKESKYWHRLGTDVPALVKSRPLTILALLHNQHPCCSQTLVISC